MTRAPRAPAGRRQPTPSAPTRRGPAAVAPALALALLPALVLAGCGGNDDAAPASTTGAPPAVTGAPLPATASGGTTAGGPDGGATDGGDATDGGGSDAGGTAVPDAGTTTPFAETYDVTVTGREVRPEPSAVDLRVGETLLLRVTADAGSEIHAHGFGELSVPVTPGQPVEMQLTAEEPGLYEVELHDPDLLLLQVAVR
jgi:hypothetical protein